MDQNIAFYIIAVIGVIALVGAFSKMNRGFGPYNLRAIGIILVATFVTLLAIERTNVGLQDSAFGAAMGLLGTIIGYLFNLKKDKESKEDVLKKNQTHPVKGGDTNVISPSSTPSTESSTK